MLLAKLIRNKRSILQFITNFHKNRWTKMESKEEKKIQVPIPTVPAVPQPVNPPKEEVKSRALPDIPTIAIPASSFSGRLRIRHLFEHQADYVNKIVHVCGWARTLRAQKKIAFITLSDGSGPQTLQIVIDKDVENYAAIEKMRVGSCFGLKGKIVQSPGSKQPIEMQIKKDPEHSVTIYGDCPAEEYPLSKKEHTVEV
jgi:lysyl-tRNA synthetase class II